MTQLSKRANRLALVLLITGLAFCLTPFEATPHSVSAQTGQPCYPNEQLPNGFLPFTQLYYVTGPNADGDYLAVGRSTFQQFLTLPLASATNQRFCQPVRLAANLVATTYVTSASERSGDFRPFVGLFLDPLGNNFPFPGGVIPANRLPDPFGFRIRPNSLSAVSAASYRGTALARESIVTVFGTGLATAIQSATGIPLPTTLAGVTVMVRDRLQVQRTAPLFFASPTQLNFLLPPGTAEGAGAIIVSSADGSVAANAVQLAAVAPGLFAANADGQGAAAAVILRSKADGSQSFEPAVRFDSALNRAVLVPIELGPESEQVFVLLFGTGLRFRSALTAVSARVGGADTPVVFVGAQGDLVGLDQINLRLPRSLAGRGLVDVALTADGMAANTVQLEIR